MNILHISPYVPDLNADHAGGVMMAKEVETLSKKHKVYEMGFINNLNDIKYAKKFNPETSLFIKSTVLSRIINAILHPSMPIMFGIRNSLTFKKCLVRNIKKWNIDAIHADYTSMGQFLWIKKKFPNIKFNITEHDVVYQSYARKPANLFNRWQLKLVYRCEKKYCQNADAVFVVSSKDEQLLKDIYGISKKVYILNPYYGVDTFGPQGNNKRPNSICFVGNMGRYENDEAAKRLISIFNKINTEKQYELYIIGANPSAEIKSLSNKSIVVTGFVDNIQREIDQCEIAVFPLKYGAGVKFKVLQALSLGLPVVTTNVGAEGIDENGEVIILAKEEADFSRAITSLLRNRSRLKKKSRECAQWAKTKFDWHISEGIFQKIYDQKGE